MRLQSLTLDDYRSWHQLDLTFAAGVTVLLGRNGVGKTNIVEAVAYLATLGSHRVASDTALIRHGCDSARVNATLLVQERRVTAEIVIASGKAAQAFVNGNKLARTRELLGVVQVVVFSPEDLDLVRRDPAVRRHFIDELLVARYPRFSSVLADFGRAVKQRASLVKSAGAVSRNSGALQSVHDSLDAWDQQMAPLAARVLLGRLDTARALQPRLIERHAQISDSGKDAGLLYAPYNGHIAQLLRDSTSDLGVPHVDESDAVAAYLRDLQARRDDELRRGVALVGPQRDDAHIMLGEHPAKGYASHGETWSVVLAMKLASFDVLREHHRDEPILILDDVFAELDAIRRERLAAALSGAEQVLVTAAVAEDVPAGLGAGVIEVEREARS